MPPLSPVPECLPDAASSGSDPWEPALFDAAPVGIALVHQGLLVHCNPHFESLLGYEPGELRGIPQQQWAVVEAGVFDGQLTLLRKDGEPVQCRVSVRAMPGVEDDAQQFLWAVMDGGVRARRAGMAKRLTDELEQLVQDRTEELRATVTDLHREIHDRKLDQERIYWLAHYDPLTGLPNRTLLAERSQQAIRLAQQNGTPLAVMFLDLDHFKHVNDSLGHRVGDDLLVEIAKRLRAIVRDRDTVARLGGDEFVLLLPGANALGAARVAGKLQEAARQPYQIGHHELTMAPSMGIALFPQDGEDFETLTQSADTAMYRAKSDGRNTFRFFTPEMHAQSTRALRLENALRRALERNQLHLHYQPQVTLRTGTIRSVEALLRWDHPELGSVSPAEFIPIAEDTGQILQIGEWVLRTALAQLHAWRAEGLEALTIAVNLSAVQFRQPQLPELIGRILDEAVLPAHLLELELTEGVAVDDPRSAIATMDQLRERGVRMSMDDFGTGYSSLSHLKRFQIYKLKIDQSFVRDLGHDPNDRAIVSAIIRMAQALGMRTTAEGVETAEQLAFLREQGCDEAQGYFLSRPMPAEQITPLLRRGGHGLLTEPAAEEAATLDL
ncbi:MULTISPECIES: EAL domain-containing protein [unclassified Acidovorax]|uniref:EAL domain-containing protein n=1 Tax=unclassified Acidovorax TaxID=2684926 RepID=UPI002883561C|nr:MULTISPECIES: EAL domain-containing protein [unclassified Acidovorax]